MDERELRRVLRGAAEHAEDAGARERAWRVVQAAYATGEVPQPRRSRRRRRALLAAVLAAAAAAATAGGVAAAAPQSAVGEWVRGLVGAGDQRVTPSLVRVPGDGRLLVTAGDSAWVVSGDGTKRRLGRYAGAAWSPHGLFVVAWRGRELTALDPAGRVRWSLSRPDGVSVARWAPVDGFRIAYLAGARLRVVYGNGTVDQGYGAARPDVAPAWRPDNAHVLAYVDRRDRINVVAVDTRRRLWRSAPLSAPTQLEWSADGRRLLAVARRGLVVFGATGRRLRSATAPAGATIERAQWAPRGREIAIVRHSGRLGRSEVVLANAARDLRERVLVSGPGRFGDVSWSPNGSQLLLAWPGADQWLFLRASGGGRTSAVTNIAAQFTPGAARAAFPRSVRWCCGDGPSTGP